jgi:O-antigen ligase
LSTIASPDVSVLVAWMACALMGLPSDARDGIFMSVAILCVGAALIDFAGAWKFFLLILPVVHVLTMFAVPQLTYVRLMLAGFVVVFPWTRAAARVPRDLLREPGFLAFSLFIVANLASAARLGTQEPIFRAATYCEPLVFGLVTYCVVRRRQAEFKPVLRALVLGGLAVALLGVVEIATQHSIFETFGISFPGVEIDAPVYFELDRFGLGGRISSTIAQPVYASLYFAMWLMVSVYYLVVLAPSHRRLLFLLVPLAVAVLVTTGTRAALLALVPASLVVAIRSGARPAVSLIAGTAAAVVVLLAVLSAPALMPYMQASIALDEKTTENANVFGRIDLTYRLLEFFGESPIWGNGPGEIQHRAQEAVPGFAGLEGQENQYAVVLADGGIVAGTAYLLFIAAALRTVSSAAWSTTSELSDAGMMALALFVFYFVVIVSVTCLTQIPNDVLMTVYGAVAAKVGAQRRHAELS